MKYYFSIFILLCFAQLTNAQDNFYILQWQAVENLEKEGKTKSAYELVNQIYKKAKIEDRSLERVKCLLFQSKYLQILDEDAQLTIINNFKLEIEASHSVTQSLLENMIAAMYWQYFKQNRYRFYNRSKTIKKVSDDFRTWDLETLFAEIHCYYQQSLENEELLQKEPLSNYALLLHEAEKSKTYRPTLFDLLSHNALEFYKTSENSISQPAYQFKIDDASYLSVNDTFMNVPLVYQDSINLQLHALKIYQKLLRFHKKDKTTKAFVSADIDRLNFVYQNATFLDKNLVLLKTLRQSSDDIKTSPTSGLYQFEIAQLYQNQGNTYQTSQPNDKMRWKIKDAMAICEAIHIKFPNSNADIKCSILKKKILQPYIQLRAEEYLPINSPSRLLVTYKNLKQLDFTIFKVTQTQLKIFNTLYKPEEQSKFFSKLHFVHSWTADLKNEGDFQSHSTELVLPKLKNGLYLVKSETKTKENVFSVAHIQVTDLALIETKGDSATTYQIINRNNGKPIVNATVEATYRNNYRDSFKTKTFTSNALGQFEFKKGSSNYRDINIEVLSNKEVAYFRNYFINKDYEQPNDKGISYKGFVFTDRSIYRPGQTIYFKAIAIKTSKTASEVLSNKPVYVTLYNTNDEELSELELKTNEFGSVSGTFILPNNGLNGEYHIEFDGDEDGLYVEHYFSVEEYKRPKFKTTFHPITETHKVNDSILVKGKALAFAGSNITNAKVVYRVKRYVQFPRWYYWRMPYYNSQPQEITFGETSTDNLGEFEIPFIAIPDDTVDSNNLPIFEYEITADVTDLNGETRSANTIVKVGYHSLIAEILAPQETDKTQKEIKIGIETKNLNGEFIPATGTLKIYKLKAPQTVLRPRPWDAPDYQTLSKTEFKTLFPHDAYSDEHLLTNWDNGLLVYESEFNTEKSKSLILKRTKKWESGHYSIELESKDAFGQMVNDKTYLNLYSKHDQTMFDYKLFDAQLNKSQYEPGEKAILTFGSAANPLFVTVEIEKHGQIIDTQIYELTNSKRSIEIPVTKNDVGGFTVHYHFAAFNDFTGSKLNIAVPYPKKDLDIEIGTFRDKLQPGEDETWSFKIKGPQGDKVTAELLAGMYDMSLDEFKSHHWSFNPINNPTYYSRKYTNAGQSFSTTTFRQFNNFRPVGNYPYQTYDCLNWFGFYFGNNKTIYLRGAVTALSVDEEMSIMGSSESLDEVVVTGYSAAQNVNKVRNLEKEESIDEDKLNTISIRKNLQETAFFFPHLQTDEEGNVHFNFTAPEALTRWKLQLLAHTKKLNSTVAQFETVTQKELMVTPNAPRFLREGDQISLNSKISNLLDKNLSGYAQLILKDAITGKNLTTDLGVNDGSIPFNVEAKNNTQVTWHLSIPEGIQTVEYTVIAISENFSDGEQNVLPVLSNRMLVTETLPMWVRSNQTKTFTLNKLQNTTSTTLKNHKLTLEMTSNPAWYAIQALPYLMEYPYDCNEQTFARYYSNALAQHIVKSNPKIKAVFNQWSNQGDLISNLEKNQELKSLLIQETPWLRDAQSESEQKKRIGLLFDLNKMNNELTNTKLKLANNQLPSGAWPWFNGGRANRYITQHIVAGFGHLKRLNVTQDDEQESMILQAIHYLDDAFIKEYKDIRKYNAQADLSQDHLSYTQLHYLYVRSFYPEIKTSAEMKSIQEYYYGQIESYWLKQSLYAKGLMTLTMHRANKPRVASTILTSLEENSINSEELGMYWKENSNSWHWYQAPIETQALLIEAFAEVGATVQGETKNLEAIDNLKIWLLKNKQSNQWKTTKATTEAVYALLLQGSDWLAINELVDVSVGGQKITTETLKDSKIEAGSGYYKTSWNGAEIKSDQAKVTITKKGEGIAWGGLYWQYFEDLDKITSAETPLKLSKKLFLKSNSDTGEVLDEIAEHTALNVGDLVRVRIELRSDRPMEFVHLKDMRAAGLEPVNVISSYKWQDGLGYYESTKDAATNFFIDYLPKGIFVFEYDLRVNNKGNMSNGISSIQSMYAPEFISHSEGTRILVEK